MLIGPQVCFAPEGSSGSASGSGVTESAPSSAPSSGGSGRPSSPSSTPSGASTQATPSSSPSPSTPGSASPVESKDGGFGEDFFSSLSEIEVEPPAEPAAVEVKPPEVPKSVEAQPGATPQPPAAAAQPVQQQQTMEPAVGADTSIPLHEPGRLADAMRQNQAQLVGALAESYKLSPEEVEALETDATSAVPKLLAKAHFNAVTGVLQNIQAMIPAMLQQHLSTYQSAQENMEKFFAQWPQLDKVKHRDEVLRVAKQYRAMNPKASGEQMMKDVGAFVALQVGVPLTTTPQASGTVAGGMRSPPPTPFVPAGNGSVSTPPPVAKPGEWDGMYE